MPRLSANAIERVVGDEQDLIGARPTISAAVGTSPHAACTGDSDRAACKPMCGPPQVVAFESSTSR